jgi:hypothetical protein
LQLFLRIVVEYAVYLCEAPAVKPEFRRTVLDKLPIILFAMATDMPQCAADVFRYVGIELARYQNSPK